MAFGKFIDSATRMLNERRDRLEMAKWIFPFGIPYLDAGLGGIFPRDLILVGARTGIGKTSLATNLALNAADRGKNVFFFALEAEELEIERRLKFAAVSKVARANGWTRGIHFNDWYIGKLDDRLQALEGPIDQEMCRTMTSLFTFYRSEEFYADHLEQMVTEVHEHADLIILDHLHYVDTDDENEHRGMKGIVKRIRDISIRLGKPVVVVAHLRKGERKGAALIPDLDDFHGSSDISKIATKAIMLAPAYEQASDKPWLWPTYMSTPKCRFNGEAMRYCAVVWYDASTGRYIDRFTLGKLSLDGSQFEIVPADKLPDWAMGGP